ncbi:MAG TPA: 1-acyl-sn-glycerol-3-phosphate acyltransferase [Paludibacter sp.]|nr:1-acyl-sn-glycerol-3-phosphate acyltransferase [Paludibacter sp.]
MSKIYEIKLPFKLVKRYVVFTFKRFYSEFIVTGQENIPTGSPVIFAPNHINALMDALAVHAVIPKNMPLVFLARSDIFKNKHMARILNFVKIMPTFRMRDGIENLDKNNGIFERCVDILDHNATIGIMPEGNQGERQQLRPLVKGIFRIAFAAQQKYGIQPGVKIVPVGIHLGHFVKCGKHIIINIGKPIEVSEFMETYNENPVLATNQIRSRLRQEIINLSLDLATPDYYFCFRSAVKIAKYPYLQEHGIPDSTYNRFVARQKIAKKLVDIEKNQPGIIEELELQCTQYEKNLSTLNLRDWVFDKLPHTLTETALESLRLLVTLPVFLVGFATNILPFTVPVYLRKHVFKVKDWGFFSSVHFLLGSLAFPFFYLVETAVFYHLSPFPWWVSGVFLTILYPVGKMSLRWYKDFLKLLARFRFRRLLRTKPGLVAETAELKKHITRMVLHCQKLQKKEVQC